MPSAWRLTKTKFASEPLNADGARLYGGRWNSQGTSVVYFAESISLATLEVLVHLNAPQLLEAYSLIRIDFDDRFLREVTADTLPETWANFPAAPETQAIGDRWVKSADSLLLRVPSAVVPLEHLLVVNPYHPDRRHLSVVSSVPFRFDPRLLT
jgi:RES domain-containing protein